MVVPSTETEGGTAPGLQGAGGDRLLEQSSRPGTQKVLQSHAATGMYEMPLNRTLKKGENSKCYAYTRYHNY